VRTTLRSTEVDARDRTGAKPATMGIPLQPNQIGDDETRSWGSTAGAGIPRERASPATPPPILPLPCCQPSGRPCLPDSTARRDTGRDQEGEGRQARRGSTGTYPPQHKQTAWGQAGTSTSDQPHTATRTQQSTVRQAQEPQQGERCPINSHNVVYRFHPHGCQ
jgi:hypothetical protein